jgi:hypothetical protein
MLGYLPLNECQTTKGFNTKVKGFDVTISINLTYKEVKNAVMPCEI